MQFEKETEEILEDLEKTQKEFWNISRETANFMNMIIKMANVQEAIEIGTSNGYSGIWIGKALKETGGHLTTIEYWDKRQSIARENFKICKVDDVITPKLGSALDVLHDEINYEIDFAFIDANKREYIEYYKHVDKILKRGGIIAADNVLSHEEKVKPFVDAIKANPDYQVEILNLPAGLLLARKK